MVYLCIAYLSEIESERAVWLKICRHVNKDIMEARNRPWNANSINKWHVVSSYLLVNKRRDYFNEDNPGYRSDTKAKELRILPLLTTMKWQNTYWLDIHEVLGPEDQRSKRCVTEILSPSAVDMEMRAGSSGWTGTRLLRAERRRIRRYTMQRLYPVWCIVTVVEPARCLRHNACSLVLCLSYRPCNPRFQIVEGQFVTTFPKDKGR